MGNLIRSEDRRGGTLEYVYDKLGSIREAKHSGGGVERFAFDPAGNILSANHPAATSAGRLKSQPPKTLSNPNLYVGNRLKEHNGTEYTYDGLGNLIYRQLPDGENQYFQYDSENQLVRAEIKKAAGNTEIWEYAYDPFGRRLSKERKDKLAWTSTEPKRIHFVWDGSRLAQEYTYKGTYTYIYTDQDSYEPLAQIFHNNKDGKQYLAYIHTDQIGIPREMTDQFGNLLWYGEYTAWGRLKKDGRVYQNAHQPFRLQNQYYDRETGLHYNLMRYYEPDTGRFISQDPIGLWGGENLYQFAPNVQRWTDILGLKPRKPTGVPGINDGFADWFNNMSPDQFDTLWSDKRTRRAIESRLRHPRGMHEWHLVSRANVFKRWGVSFESIRDLRTAISQVHFVNPVGHHGGIGSTRAHNELLDIIDSSLNYGTFKRRLNTWADYRLKGGRASLPEGLRLGVC